jgi:hypothetical protein
VIVVPDASPAGACAETTADNEPDGFAAWPCLSIVHVSPPPETDDSVTAPPVVNQPTPSTMKPPGATAADVVNASDPAAAVLALPPIVV